MKLTVSMHDSGIQDKTLNLESESDLDNLPNVFFNRHESAPPLQFLIKHQNELGGFGEVWDKSCYPPYYFGIMSWDVQ